MSCPPRTRTATARCGNCRTVSSPNSHCQRLTLLGLPHWRITWPYDDGLELLPGLNLYRTAGHFDGHSVLHDAARRLLLCGDALKFEFDPADRRTATTISTHKAFVRGVPLRRTNCIAIVTSLKRSTLRQPGPRSSRCATAAERKR